MLSQKQLLKLLTKKTANPSANKSDFNTAALRIVDKIFLFSGIFAKI